MEQQGEALAQLTNQSAELLSGDVCNQHGPAAELREQVRDLGWNGGMTEWVFWNENGNESFCSPGIRVGRHVGRRGTVVETFSQ